MLLLHGSVRNGFQFVKPSEQPFEHPRFLQMQADLRAQITVDRFRASGSLGYMYQGARPTQITHRDEHNLVSREHWLGLDLGEDKQFLLRIGRMAVPFGIRNGEHELFTRSTYVTRSNINEAQQHGVAFAYNGAMARAEIMALLGNYQLNGDKFRERGYAGYLELSLAPWAAAGLSSMVTYAKTDFVYLTDSTIRQAHGLFARLAPVEPLVFLIEADALINTTARGANESGTSPGFAATVQADIEPVQGLHLIATGETWIAGNTPGAPGAPTTTAKSFSGGAALLWFFAPHADLRFDFVASSLASAPVTYYLLPQLHIYL